MNDLVSSIPDIVLTPDGSLTVCKKIALTLYNSESASEGDIYSICPAGSGLQRLTTDPAADYSPVWSPDGEQIAFVSTRSGSAQIYVMDQNGRDQSQITFDFENHSPIWLPDNQRISFLTTDGKGLFWWRIVNLENREIDQLTSPSYDFFFQTRAWSPDGTRIAYMSLEEQKARNDGSSQIHVMDLGGMNDQALTENIWANMKPIWSPDSQQILFLSERDGGYNQFALYIMNADGTNVRRLTQSIYDDSTVYSWAPDGEEIAVGSILGRIDILNVATGEIKELPFLKESETANFPAWQP